MNEITPQVLTRAAQELAIRGDLGVSNVHTVVVELNGYHGGADIHVRGEYEDGSQGSVTIELH